MSALGRLVGRRAPQSATGARLPAAEKLDLVGVTLLSSSGREVRKVPGLVLHFDGNGLAIRREDGSSVVLIYWVSLRRLDGRLQTQKGGEPRVELTVETDRKSHRFVLPNVDPEALSHSLRSLAARYARSELVEGRKKGLRLH